MTEMASNTITKFSPIAPPADIAVIADQVTDYDARQCGQSAGLDRGDIILVGETISNFGT